MKKNKKIKIWLVWLWEQMEDNLLPSILQSNMCRIISICDINITVLEKYKKKLFLNNAYTDYSEMIEEEELDIIFVASFPQVHFDLIKICIKNNIAIFVEKPPVKDLKEFKEIMKLNSSKNILIWVWMNFSFASFNNTLNQIINNNDFGKILAINIEHVSSKPTSPLWGYDSVLDSFLLAQVIHPLDYVLKLGWKYKKINVFSSKDHNQFYIKIIIEFENNIIASIKSGNYSSIFRHNLEIIWDKWNILNIKNLDNIEIISKKHTSEMNNLWMKKTSIKINNSFMNSWFSKAWYSIEINEFINSYINQTDYKTSFDSLLDTYKALDEIYKQIINNN